MATAHQSLILSAVRADANTEVDTDYPNLLRYCTHKKAERQRVADAFFGGDLSEAKQRDIGCKKWQSSLMSL